MVDNRKHCSIKGSVYAYNTKIRTLNPRLSGEEKWYVKYKDLGDILITVFTPRVKKKKLP